MERTTEDILTELVCRHLAVDARLVTPGASLVHDLGADSLDLVELTMAIEEAFEIEMMDEETVGIRTVADALRLIDEKRAASRTETG